jgi:hypothetical protein
VDLTARLLPIFALSLPGDGINATLQGLLRWAGLPPAHNAPHRSACIQQWAMGGTAV